MKGYRSGVMANLLVSNILGCEFEHQSRCYVHFRIIAHGKGVSPINPFSNGLNSTTNTIALALNNP